VKRRRKRSRKAKAGRKVRRNLLDILESVRRKMAKRKPTPEEQAEFAEITPGPAWEGDDKWEDRIAGVMRVPRPAPLSWERNAQIAPAIEGAADPLSPLKWIFDEVDQRKKAGDIPTGPKAATVFAKQLAQRMVEDVRAGKCRRAITWRSIRARLYENKRWPLK
jgi:hypothetical protein